MINEARTLLLNRDGTSTGFAGRPGDEFIDPDFRALANLPSYLAAPRRVLYGNQSDWLFENYRTRQYMSIIHSTELEEFVTALDPRVTYDTNNDDMFRGVFGATSTREGIRFLGSPPAPDATSQSLRRWRITVLDATTVRFAQLMPRQSFQDYTYEAEGSWSKPLPLGSDKFFISFTPTPDLSWDVEQRLQPQRSMGDVVVSLEQATARYWNDLFGVGTLRASTEPWKTFRNLWLKHPAMPYRLGGFLLAIAYRMSERRHNGA